MEKIETNMGLKRKLTLGTKLGYGMGNIADSVAYDWITCFFIYFLTDFAGINPAYAGLIILISVLWDAITDPLIGTWSDRCKSKYGRRRPFIIGSALPLAISMILMFKVVPFSETASGIYYLIISLIFWTAYTAFNVPYFSLGVSLTFDEDERTKLRGYCTAFMYVGAIVATYLPMFAIGMLEDKGFDEETAWFIASIFLAIVTLITIIISWISTRGKEIMFDEEDNDEFKLSEIWEVLKPRVVLIMFAFIFIDDVSYAVANASSMYFVESVLGLGEFEASFVYLTNGVVGILVAIWLSKLAFKYDKKYLFIIFALIGYISQVIGKFIGIDSLVDACILEVFYTVGSAAGWLFSYAFVYDVTEIEEFRSGKRREGVYISYQSFVAKLGAAVGGLVSGLILEFAGYDGGLEDIPQTPEALDAIESMFTIYPAIIGLIGMIFLIMYPVTKKRYELLVENLELKRAGKEYTTEGFEKLLK